MGVTHSIVHLLQMEHRCSNRPSKHNRRLFEGEEVRQVECSRCYQKWHIGLVYTNPLPQAPTSSLGIGSLGRI